MFVNEPDRIDGLTARVSRFDANSGTLSGNLYQWLKLCRGEYPFIAKHRRIPTIQNL